MHLVLWLVDRCCCLRRYEGTAERERQSGDCSSAAGRCAAASSGWCGRRVLTVAYAVDQALDIVIGQ